MYRLLSALRYLRTRYIALASIISVTLGVATLIVVNSVMAGFTDEMHKRLHGILSDIVFESHSLGGFPDPQGHMAEISDVLGDDLVGMTAVVHVPAMVNFKIRGQWITRQVNLIGIDEKTYGSVSDFSQFLLHPENQRALSFQLQEDSYGQGREGFPPSGWRYRRLKAAYEQAYQEQLDLEREREMQANGIERPVFETPADAPQTAAAGDLPPPQGPLGAPAADSSTTGNTTDQQAAAAGPEPAPFDLPTDGPDSETMQRFDPGREQYTGVVLGIAIASVRQRDQEGEVKDFYLVRPGDDVQIVFPSAATPPTAVKETFTVVDFYESKMSEYDSSFAFIPLHKLQELRMMLDPVTGVTSVTSIQLKLRPGADLNEARDKLRARFPSTHFAYRIDTWRDMQGPLLAAVSMETTLLNILLFSIIAVAGFGILATFYMIVVEKVRDIGILKALGAPSGGVYTIFLSYGLSLGLVGSGVGTVLGLILVFFINDIAVGLEWISGREVFDPTVYYFRQIPTRIEPFTVGWVILGSVWIAVLASLLPARHAARLHPVDSLRYK